MSYKQSKKYGGRPTKTQLPEGLNPRERGFLQQRLQSRTPFIVRVNRMDRVAIDIEIGGVSTMVSDLIRIYSQRVPPDPGVRYLLFIAGEDDPLYDDEPLINGSTYFVLPEEIPNITVAIHMMDGTSEYFEILEGSTIGELIDGYSRHNPPNRHDHDQECVYRAYQVGNEQRLRDHYIVVDDGIYFLLEDTYFVHHWEYDDELPDDMGRFGDE